jgi:hypothetical protein
MYKWSIYTCHKLLIVLWHLDVFCNILMWKMSNWICFLTKSNTNLFLLPFLCLIYIPISIGHMSTSSCNLLEIDKFFYKYVIINQCVFIYLSWHLLCHAIRSVICLYLQISRSTRLMTTFCIFIAYINRGDDWMFFLMINYEKINVTMQLYSVC